MTDTLTPTTLTDGSTWLLPAPPVRRLYAITRNGRTTHAVLSPERVHVHEIAGRLVERAS